MNYIKIILFIAVVLLFSSSAFAANHYILSTATGTGTGADWTNAYTDLPTSFVRGDTYYLGDGSYGAHTFTDNESGTSYIHIKKSTVADHGTETGYVSTDHDGTATFTGAIIFEDGYYKLDGNRATVGEYGILVRVIDNANAIYFNTTLDHVTLEALDISMQDSDVCLTSTTEIKCIKSKSSGATYVTVRNCKLTNYGDAITTLGANAVYEYNHFERLDGGTNGVMTHQGDGGYCGLDGSDHGDAIVIGTNNGTVRYNVFDWAGQQVYFTGSYTNDGWKIYGNVFTSSVTNTGGAVGVKGDSAGPTLTNIEIYNNTFVSLQYGIWIRGGTTPLCTGYIYNNIFWDLGTSSVGCEATHDYNAYPSGTMYTEATKTDDAHPEILSSSPFHTYVDDGNEENDNYSLSATAVESLDAGITLSSPFNIDILGNTRGSDSKWDRGAYEYGGTADETAPTLAEVTPVTTPSTNQAPSYVFSSNEAGTVTYGGTCGAGDLSTAISGNNTVSWNLAVGTYSDCTITVTDVAQNASTPLAVTEFVIIPTGGQPPNVSGGCTFTSLP